MDYAQITGYQELRDTESEQHFQDQHGNNADYFILSTREAPPSSILEAMLRTHFFLESPQLGILNIRQPSLTLS